MGTLSLKLDVLTKLALGRQHRVYFVMDWEKRCPVYGKFH